MLEIQTTQKIFKLDLPKEYKNVGIKMSGGTDSSIIAFMLSYYRKYHRPDINLHAISMNHPLKPFQVPFAKKVVEFLEKEFEFKFSSHTTGEGTPDGNYAGEQWYYVEKAYMDNQLDGHFMGQTTNPIDYKENAVLVDQWDWRSPERDQGNYHVDIHNVSHEYEEWTNKRIRARGYYPLLFVDKKCVRELYEHFGVLDSLFPITRSCEDITHDFSHHCGKCWWCGERQYGFGRLV